MINDDFDSQEIFDGAIELQRHERGTVPPEYLEFWNDVFSVLLPPPESDAPYGVYRCMNEMRALLAWLRSHGVVSKTPLHTLRKEYGSQIHARYGLLAASEALRHGGVGVTARHYVENRSHAVLGFGHLLTKDTRTIVPINEASAKG